MLVKGATGVTSTQDINSHGVNSSPHSAAYMRQWTGPSLVQVMACRLFCAKPLPEPMMAYCQLDSWEKISEIWIGIISISLKKMHLKMSSAKMAAILSKGRWVNLISCKYSILCNRRVNPLPTGHHFPDDIFKCILMNENFVFRFQFHWSLFLRVQLALSQHWFRPMATQFTNASGTRGRWVNIEPQYILVIHTTVF